MPQLPTPGQDAGQWGDLLNEFLQVAHNSDGTPGNVVANLAALKALAPADAARLETCYVQGYHAAGDGGEGVFFWDTGATESDNGGTIIAAAAGGTGRWKRPAGGIASAKWFGARGDNTANDFAALTSAIAYTAGSGTVLHLPAGTYLCLSQLTLLDNTHIRGQGASSVIRTTGLNSLFRGDGRTNITLKEFVLEGNGGGSFDSGLGIQVVACSNILIDRVEVLNASNAGIDVYDCRTVRIEHCRVVAPYFNAIDIRNGTSHFAVNHNTILRAGRFGGTAVGKGIGVACQNSAPQTGCSNGLIEGNYIEDCNQIGIELWSTFPLVDASRNKNIVIIANTVVHTVAPAGDAFGISIACSDSCSASGNFVKNVVLGYEVADSSYVVYSSNIAELCKGAGISISGIHVNPSHVSVMGNVVRNTTGNGIQMTGECKCISISGNIVNESSQRGIELVNGGDAMLNNSIKSNLVADSQRSGIYLHDSRAVNLSDNICTNSNISGTANEGGLYTNLTAEQLATCVVHGNMSN